MDNDYEIIKGLSLEYKERVSALGPDGQPGLNDIYSAEDFLATAMANHTEFKYFVLDHPIFKDKNYKSLDEVNKSDHELLVYLFQIFFNEKKGQCDNAFYIDEEKENKKQFIKEVMEGIERKKTLKDFFDDPRSYKQYRDDIQQCLLYTEWDKIHKIMKTLKWKWVEWFDEWEDKHTYTVPSTFGIREHVINELKDMEKWINEHPDATKYKTGAAGFECEMGVCDGKEGEPDDYDHRVRFIVRFVPEQYTNKE